MQLLRKCRKLKIERCVSGYLQGRYLYFMYLYYMLNTKHQLAFWWQVGGPYWDVPLGRKDSKSAGYELVETNIPTADESLLSIITKFVSQGLSATDMVALSGN